ncbi:MAG: bis(5'-nucleosyl)-tetraphosphatase (symmetrical) YqeK [Candidatus Improbicoccus pseudotrichonymphae]|uniref:bis(5'-nucleosyl)-tetraphosphatase (symmetrical) n=1 Tax=Candidatus Improbicoccus pseudotrichonymphae TaxID=3033792 RepID=A0AA48I4I0_9FIRM|nr:MAG: bis(5'-nucleosyl)-tetraphosphatase (symmetrical) YqeK [Candidatus Improbicoccus pseudotrichonymphae]
MLLYENFVRKNMSEKRYIHSVNVAKVAAKLAKKYGGRPEKARIAGILHDITKEWGYRKHLDILKKYGVKVNKYEINSKKLLHALSGSVYIKYILEIKDKDIINSVRYHTTARSGMSLLEKVVYIADFISEERTFFGVEYLRSLADKSLDSVFPAAINQSMRELINSKRIIHPNTFNAYNESIKTL